MIYVMKTMYTNVSPVWLRSTPTISEIVHFENYGQKLKIQVMPACKQHEFIAITFYYNLKPLIKY